MLTVISRVGVVANAVEDDNQGTVNMTFDVHFHFGPLVTHPLNLGAMPLFGLQTGGIVGLVDQGVSVVQRGLPPVNFSFPEQLISLNATASLLASIEGGLSFSFNGHQTSTTVPVNATSTELRDCLSSMDSIGEIEVFQEVNPYGLAWLVRFYSEGDPAHIGPQPSILVNTTQIRINGVLVGRRLQSSSGLSVSLTVTSEGGTPFDSSQTSDEALSQTAGSDYTGVNSSEVMTLVYQPPLHVCGNGIRSSAEICDDNNTVGGDGCDSLCRIEVGWNCSSSNTEGTGIGGVDTCAPLCGDGRRILWVNNEQ